MGINSVNRGRDMGDSGGRQFVNVSVQIQAIGGDTDQEIGMTGVYGFQCSVRVAKSIPWSGYPSTAISGLRFKCLLDPLGLRRARKCAGSLLDGFHWRSHRAGCRSCTEYYIRAPPADEPAPQQALALPSKQG